MMALEAPIEFQGLKNERGYWRLKSFSWNSAEPQTARMSVDGYASKESFEEGVQPLVTREYVKDAVSEDGNTDMVQIEMMVRIGNLAYMEIKSFPEFNKAIDV
jgi:hypothetical protein